MYRYALKNIKWMYCRHRPFFLLMLFLMALSSGAVAFFYGLHGNYQNRLFAMQTSYSRLPLELNGEVSKGELEVCLKAFSPELQEKLMAVIAETDAAEGIRLQVHFQMQDGQYKACQVFRENLLRNGMADIYFTNEEEEAGEPVTIAGNGLALQYSLEAGKEMSLNGKKYRIIGKQNWLEYGVFVPFASLEDKEILAADTGIQLHFLTPLKVQEYQQIREILGGTLGGRIRIPELNVVDENEFRLYRTVLLTMGVVTLLAVMNFMILYQYILMKRRTMQEIFFLCGLTRWKQVLLYLEECVLLCVFSSAAGILLFILLGEPLMYRFFPYIDGVYSMKIYLELFSGFVGISMAVLAGFALIAGRRNSGC